MKLIPLTRGYEAMVDDEDAPIALMHKWHAVPRYRKDGSLSVVYANTALPDGNGGQIKTSLHRLLMGANGSTEYVDHIDHDGLNCQRSNLRLVNGTQNQGNRRRRIDGSSRYKGVIWQSDHKSWRAAIKTYGKCRFLGYFKSEEDAARAYDAAAIAYFGDCAHTNFREAANG
jgi:hypothetical protein